MAVFRFFTTMRTRNLTETGLPEITCVVIQNILEKYPMIEKAVLYGSRAKGNYKPGSDIDLTLLGDALDYQILSAVACELDESSIPYTVDLSWFEEIENPVLIEHIQRVGIIFYQTKDCTKQFNPKQ